MSSASTSKFHGSAEKLQKYYTKQLVKYYLAAGLDRPRLKYADVVASDDFCIALGIDKERLSEPDYLRDVLGRLAAGKNEDGSYLSQFFAPPNRTMIAEDVTLSAPKSVSVAYALATDDETREKIEIAHRRAVAAAHERIKKDIGFARRGKDGLERVEAEIAIFAVHQTDARPISERALPMPHLHSHGVIPNVAFCPIDGKVRAIDFRGLDPLAYSTEYQRTLASELRAAGFTLRQGRHSFEIATVSDELVDLYSPRTAEIRQAAEMLAVAENPGLDPSTMTSSQRKIYERRAQKEKADKREEFEDLNVCLAAWAARAGDKAPADVFGGQASNRDECLEAARAALKEHAESIAVVDRSKIDAIIAAHTLAIDIPDAERAALEQQLFDEFFIETVQQRKMSQGAIEEALAARGQQQRVDGADVARAVSKIALDAERAALATSEELARQRRSLAIDIDAALEKYTLTEEQAEAIRGVAHGNRLEFLKGGAGVGKTYALKPLVDAQIAAGGTVYGAAVANKIAFALEDAGITKANLMSLHKLSGMAAQGKLKIDKNSMILLDEASMIGCLDINRIFDAAKASGARIVIVGDDSQIDAVGLQSLQIIQEGLRRAGAETRSILTTVRQKNEIERAIANAFRNGIEANLALGYLDDNSRLKFGEDRMHALRMCAAQWHKAKELGQNHVFIAPSNAEAQEIALMIRAERDKLGELTGEERRIAIVGNRGIDEDAENSMLLRCGDRIRFHDRVAEKPSQRGGRPKELCLNGTIARFVRFDTDENGKEFVVAEYLDKHDRPMKDPEALLAAAIDLANGMRSKRIGAQSWRNGDDFDRLPKKLRDELLERARAQPDVPTVQFRVPVDKIRDRETGRIKLSYADASTVHSAQGISAARTTGVALDGTKQINAKLGYVTASRHEHDFTFIVNRESLDREMREAGFVEQIERSDRIMALGRAFQRDTRRPFAVTAIDNLVLEDERSNSMTKEQIRAALTGQSLDKVRENVRRASDTIDTARAEQAAETISPAVAALAAASKARRAAVDKLADSFDRARNRLAEIVRGKAISNAAAKIDVATADRAIVQTADGIEALQRSAAERRSMIERMATSFSRAQGRIASVVREARTKIADRIAVKREAAELERTAPAVAELVAQMQAAQKDRAASIARIEEAVRRAVEWKRAEAEAQEKKAEAEKAETAKRPATSAKPNPGWMRGLVEDQGAYDRVVEARRKAAEAEASTALIEAREDEEAAEIERIAALPPEEREAEEARRRKGVKRPA